MHLKCKVYTEHFVSAQYVDSKSLYNCWSYLKDHHGMKVHALGTLLKRKICLISLFPEDKDETFEPPMPTSSRPYYLLGCNKVHFNNFYISFFKDESSDPEMFATQ
jgi:hypothetical protein